MKVFIDPGHNHSKFNTGASGNGLREQDITFLVAEKLSAKLKKTGIDVMMSRNAITDNVGSSDKSSINKRVEMANNFKADYTISLHCDGSLNPLAKGSHICIFKKGGEAEKLAMAINPYLLNLGLDGRSSQIVERENLAILRDTKKPAILIEMGFISNKRDSEIQRNNQEGLADAIFKGICDYLKISSKIEDDSIKNNVVKQYDVVTAPSPVAPTKYSVIGTTHVIEIDPRNIWAVETQCSTKNVNFNNFVNSVFFMPLANGSTFPQGMVVNAGNILSNYATHDKPVATLICYGWNDVRLKYISDITKEKDVWFAISGYGIYPKITATEEGFTGKFSDVVRTTDRPIIGYRKSDNKIVIAVRANSDASRASLTAKNLGLDFAISLDGGGSTTLRVNGKYKFKGDGRKIWGGIIWN